MLLPTTEAFLDVVEASQDGSLQNAVATRLGREINPYYLTSPHATHYAGSFVTDVLPVLQARPVGEATPAREIISARVSGPSFDRFHAIPWALELAHQARLITSRTDNTFSLTKQGRELDQATLFVNPLDASGRSAMALGTGTAQAGLSLLLTEGAPLNTRGAVIAANFIMGLLVGTASYSAGERLPINLPSLNLVSPVRSLRTALQAREFYKALADSQAA